MIRNCFLVLTSITTIFACATTPRPQFEFSPGTRIGIVSNLENQLTHRHFGSLRFGNFSKKIDVDWDIPANLDKKLSRALEADPRYTVILIKPQKPLTGINQDPDISNRTITSKKIKPETAEYLGSLADQYDADVLIFVRSYRGPSVFKIDKHPIELQGYGLFTQQLLMIKHAYAYANIVVEVFKTRPLTYIGSGKPKIMKSPLSDFDLSGNLKNLPQSEINKIQPIIQKYADQAIVNALDDANLILSK
jgi:hypothetical protein